MLIIGRDAFVQHAIGGVVCCGLLKCGSGHRFDDGQENGLAELRALGFASGKSQ